MRCVEKIIIFLLILLVFAQSAAGDDMPQVKALFQLTNSTFHEYDASWSPDDSKIVYSVEGVYGSELWVMDLDSSSKVKYLQSSAWFGQPDWGENGILYTSDYSPRWDRHLNIWILEGESLISRQLTTNKTDQQNPMWNNDSTKILFLGRANYYYEIWTMDPDASNITRLTYYQTDIKTPAWSPDGTRIAYSLEGDIWVMNADATNPVQLTDDDYEQTDPTWSPDGVWIAFVSDENGDKDIWIMRSDGTEKTVLINESRNQTDPKWSHDGTKLLYTSYQDLNGDIWAAALYYEPGATPTATPLPTPIIVDEETRENISRLTIVGAVFVILILLFIVRRVIQGLKNR